MNCFIGINTLSIMVESKNQHWQVFRKGTLVLLAITKVFEHECGWIYETLFYNCFVGEEKGNQSSAMTNRI
jgi:hypothetical protein